MADDPGAPHLNAADCDRYSVVLFGSPEVMAAVQALRDQLPPSGRPILPGHVTVKGTFINPVDLNRTAQTVREIAARHAPITITADACRAWTNQTHCVAYLEVEQSEPLAALHWDLVRALADHGETIYEGEAEGQFHPHLTIVQEVAADQEAEILETIGRSAHRFTWTAPEVALVGRRGGKVWVTLVGVPLLG